MKNMDAVMEILQILIFFAFLAAFVYVMVTGVMKWNTNRKIPVISTDADVRDKQENEIPGINRKKPGRECFLVFECSGGELVTLRVTPNEYDLVEVGDNGTLNYRADILLSFEVIRQGDKPANDKPKRA